MAAAGMSEDWYFINTGGETTMVIGPGCRGTDVTTAARDWVRRGGAVTVSGPDRSEFMGQLLSRLGRYPHTVDSGSGSLRLSPRGLSDTA